MRGAIGAYGQGFEKAGILEPVVNKRAFPLGLQQALLAHQPEMVRDEGLGQPGGGHDLGDRPPLRANDLDDVQAAAVRQGLKKRLQLVQLFHINPYSYKRLFI
jgi:hypothetical protein